VYLTSRSRIESSLFSFQWKRKDTKIAWTNFFAKHNALHNCLRKRTGGVEVPSAHYKPLQERGIVNFTTQALTLGQSVHRLQWYELGHSLGSVWTRRHEGKFLSGWYLLTRRSKQKKLDQTAELMVQKCLWNSNGFCRWCITLIEVTSF
jgi:hypothetical protein